MSLPEITLQVSAMLNHQENLRMQLQSLLQEISKLKADISTVASALMAHNQQVNTVQCDMDKHKTLVLSLREEFARNLMTAQNSISKMIEDRMSIVPKLHAKHDCLKTQMDKYEQHLESIGLDAENAVLKANNLEMQTALHKKKLDNFQLTLQNRDLKK